MMGRPCDALPPVRGTYTADAPLKDLVWFRAGGPAEVLFRPADADDLATFMSAKPADVRVIVIGVGSNLLIRDGGIRGVVVRLPGSFGKITVDGTRITAGAAALDANVARTAAESGIAGLEFLRGIPGTIGGALRMNAGCYGREIKDVFVEATAVTGKGDVVTLKPADMGFVYRKTQAPDDMIFLSAAFEGSRDDPAAIKARMDKLMTDREASQPVKTRTGGSTFKNPPGHSAWKLIDEAGCRGLMHGPAQVSPLHCNFLINTGEARAADIEALGEEVRARVKEKSGIQLEWEIKRVGIPT
ncbi:MAG: UDP-N-acetylmuramate dehydrogenase [Alphaproteobacteria bacterium]|nr:UDP-N-acetylmuramate dehydrogenase [Alphaproteobacteria bacterium]MBL7097575.1 UDP-N-acetylmuramate dehydrogenase [Alphaproteobacteria bacterium]